MDKMDTQGMSREMTPEEKEKWEKSGKKQVHKPWRVRPRRLHTPQQVKELKILFNEILDEREGRMNYTSYFDTEKFEYYVGEEEPEYKPRRKEKYNPGYYQ